MADIRHRHAGGATNLDGRIGTDDNDGKGRKKLIHNRLTASRTSFTGSLVATLTFIALVSVTAFRHTQLPAAKPEETLQQHEFNAHNALRFLDGLAKFGPKTTGSRACEELAPKYIKDQLESLQADVLPNKNIEVEVQRPSGSFFMDFLGGFTNVYDNVTNVVVRVSDTGRLAHDALMMNCHYDTNIDAVGASDDGVSCAIAFDLIRLLAHSPEMVLLYDVVFVFNGAEEAFMEGAHGFITQHRWAKDIRTFVNLEAAGSGGREVVFQTGPGDEIASLYASLVPHPHGNVLLQELFETGVIPGDTDFRVYRDFGGIPGVDLAFIANGYVYHTKLDTVDRIPLGAVQRAGENILAMLTGFQSMLQMEDAFKPSTTKPVFFDVLGLCMVTYGHSTKHILHTSMLLLLGALLAHRNSRDPEGMFRASRAHSVSIVGGILCSMLVGCAMLAISPMSWFTNHWYVLGLYGTSAVLGSQTVLRRLVDQLSPAQVFDGAAFIAFLLLLFLAMLGLGAAYLPFLWCLGAAMVMIAEMVWPPTARGVSRPQVVAIECVGFILPVLCANQLGMIIGQLVVPLAGRIGHIPVDIIVGVLTALSIVTSTRFVIRHWVGRRNKVGYFITVAMATVLVATIGFSIHATVYTDETPKRLYLQHMSRRWHDETGAVTKESNDLLIVTPDYKDIEPLIPYHDAYRDATPCECGEVYCDVPWYMSIQEMFGNGYCLDLDTIPKASVEFEWRPRIAVSSVPALDGNDPKKSTTRTIHVELEGPEHMNMYIPVSRNDAKVIKWDIHEEAELPTTNPLNTYFIFTASGSPWRSYAFSFTIQGTSAHEPYPFAIAGFKFEAPHNSTDYMNDVATALPEWATEAVFTSTWDGFRG